MQEISQALKKVLKDEQIFFNVPMKNHTSFKVGGNAFALVLPTCSNEITFVINLCKQYNFPYFIMGNGSNLLVKDSGFEGIIIKIGKNMSTVTIDFDNGNSTILAGAGILLSNLANVALKNSLTGMEFASGIPGSFGGAIFMNAGAYGGEMKDIVCFAEVLTKDGEVKRLNNEQLEFSYRESSVQKQEMIILSGCISLKPGNKELIKMQMDDLNKKRNEKQPLDKPSCGSTFKRPEGHFAGKLIMDCGLSGYKIGGAIVSPKHCGFIVNDGSATASDILNLIEHIIIVVKNKFNLTLEPEVKLLGRVHCLENR